MAHDEGLLEQLIDRAQRLEAEIVTKQERVAALQGEIRAGQAALDAIQQLVAYESGSGPNQRDLSPKLSLMAWSTPAPRATQKAVIADAARGILLETGPLHFAELTKRLQAKGIVIGGSDPGNGVIGALVRDPRFYRSARGTYALVETAPAGARSVGTRHRRRA